MVDRAEPYLPLPLPYPSLTPTLARDSTPGSTPDPTPDPNPNPNPSNMQGLVDRAAASGEQQSVASVLEAVSRVQLPVAKKADLVSQVTQKLCVCACVYLCARVYACARVCGQRTRSRVSRPTSRRQKSRPRVSGYKKTVCARMCVCV